MAAALSAGEYSYPASVPLLRPNTPASDGPILFTPGWVAWQMPQWLANSCCPAAPSPAARPVDEPSASAAIAQNADFTAAAIWTGHRVRFLMCHLMACAVSLATTGPSTCCGLP